MDEKKENVKMLLAEIEEIVRPGRKVANAFQGNVSVDLVKKILSRPTLSLEAILERLRLVFQPQRRAQEVIVPHFSSFFELISKERELVIYKGVSFNPYVATLGENVNLLDFYSWIKVMGARAIVLDASWYALINMAKRVPVEKFSSQAAQEAIKFLEQEKENYPEIRQAAETREKYLRAISASLFPSPQAPLVISAEEMWQEAEYIPCLQQAIEFCADYPSAGDKIFIKRYANYQRYGTEFQRWYTVLVLAEVLYLNRIYGVNIKVGPTSESNFDFVIKKFMAKLGIPFGFVWYNRQIESQIPYSERLSFSDDEVEIRRKLSQPLLREWIEEILGPFIGREELEAGALSIIERVNRVVKKGVTRTGIQGGWWLEFPPGDCD